MAILNYQSGNDAAKETGVLFSLFGPSKKQVWQRLAEQISGSFVDGGFFGRDKVVAHVGQWTVTLDSYTISHGKSSTTYTRIRAPYVNRDGFRFTIYRAGVFTALGEMLGLKDIRIGDAVFDEAFVIKSTDETKVRQLLADETIRALMNQQPRIRVEVKDDDGWFGYLPGPVDELYFVAAGVIKDLELLHGLFDLFAAILHRLCHIGSAYEDDPGITL